MDMDNLEFASNSEVMNSIIFTAKIKCFHIADENLSNWTFVMGTGNINARIENLLAPAHCLRVEYDRVDQALRNGETILVLLPDGVKKFRLMQG